MEPKTPQEILNIVVPKLLNQKKRSENGDGCAYRGDYGLRCAVGFIIPDEEYKKDFEGQQAHKLPIFKGWNQKAIDLLTELQNIHDDYPEQEWKKELTQLAQTLKLVLPT